MNDQEDESLLARKANLDGTEIDEQKAKIYENILKYTINELENNQKKKKEMKKALGEIHGIGSLFNELRKKAISTSPVLRGKFTELDSGEKGYRYLINEIYKNQVDLDSERYKDIPNLAILPNHVKTLKKSLEKQGSELKIDIENFLDEEALQVTYEGNCVLPNCPIF